MMYEINTFFAYSIKDVFDNVEAQKAIDFY